ncbi:MAG: hypothetical protein QXG52_02020 [Candidatus Caldarchaeum sp.]
MATKLRKDFIKLLEEDREFRYTVAGYLGLSEILKRLDTVQDQIRGLQEAQNKLWEEVRSLREGQNKLWEEVRSLREGQNKLWEEVRSLREGQNKLWEEVRSLREGQNKLWEEVRSLREGQNKLWEEVRSLREGQNKLWEEVRSLREGQNRLWEEVKNLRAEQMKLRNYVVSGFTELRSALGVTFEMHAAAYLELVLDEMGYSSAKINRKLFVHDGEVVEVNLFCEEPLVVGEVTVAVRSEEDAVREVAKLVERVDVVVSKFGRKPDLTVLSVGRASPEAAEKLRAEAEKHGVRLVLGREIEEFLSV